MGMTYVYIEYEKRIYWRLMMDNKIDIQHENKTDWTHDIERNYWNNMGQQNNMRQERPFGFGHGHHGGFGHHGHFGGPFQGQGFLGPLAGGLLGGLAAGALFGGYDGYGGYPYYGNYGYPPYYGGYGYPYYGGYPY